jgi:hypothetical protein
MITAIQGFIIFDLFEGSLSNLGNIWVTKYQAILEIFLLLYGISVSISF